MPDSVVASDERGEKSFETYPTEISPVSANEIDRLLGSNSMTVIGIDILNPSGGKEPREPTGAVWSITTVFAKIYSDDCEFGSYPTMKTLRLTKSCSFGSSTMWVSTFPERI